MNNWYSKIRTVSMSLPAAEGYPLPFGSAEYTSEEMENKQPYALKDIDKSLTDPSTVEENAPLSYIGSGVYGIAYKDKYGTMTKLTQDETEYKAALKIMELQQQINGKLSHVLQVYSAKKIPNSNLYIIREEPLIRLNSKEVQKVDFLFSHSDSLYLTNSEITTNSIVESLVRDWHYSKEDAQNMIPYITKYRELIFEMEKLGLRMSDLHGRNIGKREENGNYVLLDLGFSV